MPSGDATSKGAPILVVDDDDGAREVLRSTIERLGHAVVDLPDGARLIETARALRPRAILLDIMMPGSDGYALLLAIRGDPALKDVPVWLVSGEPEEVHEAIARAMGAQGYLQKPYDVKGVKAIVDGLAAGGGAT